MPKLTWEFQGTEAIRGVAFQLTSMAQRLERVCAEVDRRGVEGLNVACISGLDEGRDRLRSYVNSVDAALDMLIGEAGRKQPGRGDQAKPKRHRRMTARNTDGSRVQKN
jgi:hypothetical protein